MTDEERAIARRAAIRGLANAETLETLDPDDDQLRAAMYSLLHRYITNDGIIYLAELLRDRSNPTA